MGYLDNKGLEHFSWLVKNKLAKNQQMTKSAPVVQFCPAPETELEPIVDFIFTETPPAEGTKGPDSPSTITGVSNIVVARASKNIFYLNDFPYSQAGVTISVDSDGVITLNGTCTGGVDSRQWVMPITPPAKMARPPSITPSGEPALWMK